MSITRRYLCDDCEHEFTRLHWDRDDPVPECPSCASQTKSIPTSFAITGIKSKAIDYTQKMAEEQFGMTNMRDNSYEGDTAVLPPSAIQTSEREALTRAIIEASPEPLSPEQAEQVSTFWKPGSSMVSNDVAQVAAPAAAAARALGADPIEMLHKGERAAGHQHRLPLDVVARSKVTGDS